MAARDPQDWLRVQCNDFIFRHEGVYVTVGDDDWPLATLTPADLSSGLVTFVMVTNTRSQATSEVDPGPTYNERV